MRKKEDEKNWLYVKKKEVSRVRGKCRMVKEGCSAKWLRAPVATVHNWMGEQARIQHATREATSATAPHSKQQSGGARYSCEVACEGRTPAAARQTGRCGEPSPRQQPPHKKASFLATTSHYDRRPLVSFTFSRSKTRKVPLGDSKHDT